MSEMDTLKSKLSDIEGQINQTDDEHELTTLIEERDGILKAIGREEQKADDLQKYRDARRKSWRTAEVDADVDQETPKAPEGLTGLRTNFFRRNI